MKKFCGQCGAPLDAEGKCAKCGASAEISTEKTIPKSVEKGTKNNPKKKVNLVFLIVVLVLSLYTVTMITLGTLVYMNKINIPFMNDMFVFWGWKDEVIAETAPVAGEGETPEAEPENVPEVDADDTEEYTVDIVDADEYFENNSNVVSKISVADSADVHSESETYDNLVDRGFNQNPIITNYSMQGDYSDDMEISSYSSQQHPMYQTQYVTPNGVGWQILEINGAIMAFRISEDMTVGVVVSETNTITSYDSVTNKFYINTPNESIMKITKVTRIDSTTLDNFN